MLLPAMVLTLQSCTNGQTDLKEIYIYGHSYLIPWFSTDMGTKLLRLQLRLHEAEAFEAKASASASAS